MGKSALFLKLAPTTDGSGYAVGQTERNGTFSLWWQGFDKTFLITKTEQHHRVHNVTIRHILK